MVAFQIEIPIVCDRPAQVTEEDAGSYRAAVSDKRGEDVSALNLLGDGETRLSLAHFFKLN